MGIVVDYTSGFHTPSPSGEKVGTVTLDVFGRNVLDLDTGNVFSATVQSALLGGTFVFQNPPASGTAYGFTLKVDGSASTMTWPASVVWAGGVTPTATGLGETDVFTFFTLDGGTTYYGFQAGDAMA